MLALYLLWQIYYVHRAPQQASSINIIPFEVVSIDISQPRFASAANNQKSSFFLVEFVRNPPQN